MKPKSFFILVGFIALIQSGLYSQTIELNIRVLLQGLYDPVSNSMHTDLVQSGFLPFNQPYSPALPYCGNMNPCWYYQGDDSVTVFPQGVVDWVILELRDAQDATSALPATTIGKKAVFLMQDGHIRSLDGTSFPVFNGSITQGLFVVVWHRNHAGVMSSLPVPDSGNGHYIWDFSQDKVKTHGDKYTVIELEPGVWGMVAGDSNADMSINPADENEFWLEFPQLQGYLAFDLNLDGNITSANDIFLNKTNSGFSSFVPH